MLQNLMLKNVKGKEKMNEKLKMINFLNFSLCFFFMSMEKKIKDFFDYVIKRDKRSNNNIPDS